MSATVTTPDDLDGLNSDVASLKQSVANGRAALQDHADKFVEVDENLAKLDDRVTTLEQRPPDGGGTGSGYVGVPYVVIDHPDDASVKAGIKAWLDSRSNGFPTKKLLFAFIGTANLTTAMLPSGTGQIQGARWEGLSKRGTVLSWGSSSTPLLTSKGQLRNWEFKDFTFNSRVANGKGLYLWSSVNNPGSNQDGTFDRIEFTGSWDYAIGLDGDSKSNLNSELTFRQLACSNSTTFQKALLWSGMSPEYDQQDQFLNFHFEDCKFEGNWGTYLRFDKGGNITIDGFSSWMHIGNGIDTDSEACPMILLPEGSHFDSTMFLKIDRARMEQRHKWSKFLDAGWGARGRIVLDNVDTTAKAYVASSPSKVNEIMSLRGGHTLTMRSSGLGGWVGLRGSKGAKVVTEESYSAMPDGAGVTWALTDGASSAGAFRRVDGAGSLVNR